MFNARVAWVPSVFSLVAWLVPIEYRATMRYRGMALAQVALTLLMVLVGLALSAGVVLTEHWHCYKASTSIRDYNQGRCNDVRAPAHAWHGDHAKPWEIGLYTISGVVIAAFIGVRVFWGVKLFKAGRQPVPTDFLKRAAVEGKIPPEKWKLLHRLLSKIKRRKSPPARHTRLPVAEVMVSAFLYPIMVLIGYSSFALAHKSRWRIAARYTVLVAFVVNVILVGVWGHEFRETCCYKHNVPHRFGSCLDTGSLIRTDMDRLSHPCIETPLPARLSAVIGVMVVTLILLYLDCYIDYHIGHVYLTRHHAKIAKAVADVGVTSESVERMLYIADEPEESIPMQEKTKKGWKYQRLSDASG